MKNGHVYILYTALGYMLDVFSSLIKNHRDKNYIYI